jgi:hypothetical protein
LCAFAQPEFTGSTHCGHHAGSTHRGHHARSTHRDSTAVADKHSTASADAYVNTGIAHPAGC